MTEAGDVSLACRLFALDPFGLVLHLRSPAGAARDVLLASLGCVHATRRCPLGIDDDRLLGGLDLPATLAAGRSVAQRGLLAQADGGLLLLPMAERLTREAAARLCPVLDAGEVIAERDGIALREPARIGMVLLDEGLDDEAPPASLLERAVFQVRLDGAAAAITPIGGLAAARRRLSRVRCPAPLVQALCEAALALGIASLRAPILALRMARAACALAGRQVVSEADAMLAARLVLAWRATTIPADAAPPEPQADSPAAADGEPRPTDAQEPQSEGADGAGERMVEAVRTALPADLLERLRQNTAAGSQGGGRAEGVVVPAAHGRPLHARAGRPQPGQRLAVIDTLRAAAPWQAVRSASVATRRLPPRRVQVRASDFRVTPRAQSPRRIAIFLVDASGSAAMHRLAEAKGAIERLLSDCYVRRDRVALIAFRGRAAEILLPPTGALTRARRSLAGLPGGGGTPLASGLQSATELSLALRRRGETPLVVLLTDGRANITEAGGADRALASEQAGRRGAALRAAGIASLLVDISPRAEARAEALAGQMGALYLKLPDAEALSRAVREAAA